MDYTIGSEQITFSAQAEPAELRGKTETRWYVADSSGHKVISGLGSEAEAQERAVGRVIDAIPTDVRLTDGQIVQVPLGSLRSFVGLDAHGHRVFRDHGLTYPVTDCCAASGKGSQGAVVCRACYRVVGWEFGCETEVTIPVAGIPVRLP